MATQERRRSAEIAKAGGKARERRARRAGRKLTRVVDENGALVGNYELLISEDPMGWDDPMPAHMSRMGL